MRLDAVRPGTEAYRFFLNGKQVEDVVAADEEAGTILIIEHDRDGRRVPNSDPHSTFPWATRALKGAVRIARQPEIATASRMPTENPRGEILLGFHPIMSRVGLDEREAMARRIVGALRVPHRLITTGRSNMRAPRQWTMTSSDKGWDEVMSGTVPAPDPEAFRPTFESESWQVADSLPVMKDGRYLWAWRWFRDRDAVRPVSVPAPDATPSPEAD